MTIRCSACGATPETPRSNGSDKISLSISRSALPNLLHALTIERNVQMMGGGSAAAQGLMEEMRAEILNLIPACASSFKAHHWATMGSLVCDGADFTLDTKRSGPRSWSPNFRAVVTIESDQQTIAIESSNDLTQEQAEHLLHDLREELERIRPLR